MEEQRKAPASTLRRAALSFAVLVGLLGVVAIGSAGHTQVNVGGRRPYYAVADTVGSLILVLLALTVVVVVWTVISGRDYLAAQRLANRKSKWRSILIFGILALVFALPFARGLRHAHPTQQPPQLALPTAGGDGKAHPTAGAYKPHFATTPVLIVLGLAGGVVVAAYLAHRPRRRVETADEASLALSLADVLDDTLDDLRAEPDPRRAVIAAYARLERTLGAFGLPRRAAEAPDEYVHRIFVDLGVNSRYARELTQLFARAKFSQHRVDQAMKEEAIQLLVTIRTGLREADERAKQQALFDTAAPRTAS